MDDLATPIPIKVFHNLNNNETVISYNKILRNKAGIYCFINTVNHKRYIGSAKDLYLRLIVAVVLYFFIIPSVHLKMRS